MHRILLAVASPNELAAFSLADCALSRSHVEILYTGVGVASAALALGTIDPDYELAISVGFAGYTGTDLPIGEAVRVQTDCFLDYAVVRNGNALPLHRAGFDQFVAPDGGGRYTATTLKALPAMLSTMPARGAYTVSMPTLGEAERLRRDMLPANQLETMEGAAVAMACLHHRLPLLSLRVISNYVAPPPDDRWNARLAQQSLANLLTKALIALDNNLPLSHG